jgi:hypothetical protein
MRRNHAVRGIYRERFVSRWQHSKYNRRVGNAVHRGRLHKRSVHRWHGFAAILRVMTVRRALHRIAALHRLLGGHRRAAVECIRRESDCQHRQKNWPS